MKRNSTEAAVASAPTRKLACIRPRPLAELQAKKSGNANLTPRETTTITTKTTSLISTPNHQIGTLTKMVSLTRRNGDAERSSSATLLLLRPVLPLHPLLLVVGAPQQVTNGGGGGGGDHGRAVNIGQPLGLNPLFFKHLPISSQHNEVVQHVARQQRQTTTTTVIRTQQTKVVRPRITEVSRSEKESVAEPEVITLDDDDDDYDDETAVTLDDDDDAVADHDAAGGVAINSRGESGDVMRKSVEDDSSSSSDEYESDDGEDVALRMLINIDRLQKKRKLQDEFLKGPKGGPQEVPAHRKILEPIKNHLFSSSKSPAWLPPMPIPPMAPVPPMVMKAGAEMPQVIPVLDTNAPRESRPRGADCVFSSSAGYLRPVCAERPSSPSRDWLGRMFEETPRDGSLQKWYLGRRDMKIPAHNTIDSVQAPRLARRVKQFKKRRGDRPSPLEPFRTEGYYTIYGDIDDRLYNKKQDAGVYERRYPLDPEAFIHPDFRGVDPKHPREKEREGFYRRRFYDG